jgi:hypothetical protein
MDAVLSVSVLILSPFASVRPSLPLLQSEEPDFWIETFPPAIDKTVKGSFPLFVPHDVRPKNKERNTGTNSRILNSKEWVILIYIPPVFGNIGISMITLF